MLKHIGKHGEKKVAVLFREVPNESHMCLVVYSDILPRIYHDAVMQVLESAVGQQSENLADALFRSMMPDGVNALEALHKNGLIKKVPTNQIVMTPTTVNNIRLDELNELLNEMQKGEDAIKRLAEIDASKGMSNKKKRPPEPREVGLPPNSRSIPAEPSNTNPVAVLSDTDLAHNLQSQAERMITEAKMLMAEAQRLQKEASALSPAIIENETNVKPSTKKKTAKAKAA